ncbi:MAG: hypothetical protein K1X53_07220 [Candidatus Sumerlaeaceae bacterium]|nr:hypothetical protein [Candidatus Sumerlaeaceae bacterium]
MKQAAEFLLTNRVWLKILGAAMLALALLDANRYYFLVEKYQAKWESWSRPYIYTIWDSMLIRVIWFSGLVSVVCLLLRSKASRTALAYGFITAAVVAFWIFYIMKGDIGIKWPSR